MVCVCVCVMVCAFEIVCVCVCARLAHQHGAHPPLPAHHALHVRVLGAVGASAGVRTGGGGGLGASQWALRKGDMS